MKFPLLIPALLLAGCSAGSEAEDAADPVALVSLARAEQGVIAAEVTMYGTAESGAAGKQALAAPADAVVSSIAAPVGTRVAQGDVVAVLSAAPTTRLDLTKAATDARAADAAFARAQRLRSDGLVSDAEVEAARAAAASGLTIPYAALLDDGGQPFVYVAKDGVAHRHDVETGPATGDRIAIIKGISVNDQVVTQGGTALEDGMKVRTK